MFLGTYYHNLDERNRVSVPKKFREVLGVTAIITRGLDGCLFLFNRDSWEKIEQKLLAMPLTKADARSFSRHMLSGAMDVEVDRLGRILIPKYLTQFAGIANEVVILGVGERIEIWDKKGWESYSEKLEDKGNEIAERLSDLGI